MPIVLTRATKQEARYKALGGAEHCSRCRFFMPQGTCGRIIGPVSPEGWCKYYSREAVQRWSNPGYAGSGGGLPAGATLNLNFLTPGTLDPLITFTRASTATYFDATGTMQTAAINAPRWDYDPVSLQLRGLLIEEPRTNLAFPSSDLSNAAWTLIGSGAALPVVTGNQTPSPDGTTTAARIVFPAVPASARSAVRNGPTASASSYSFSIWLRGAVGGEALYLFATPDGVTFYRQLVTLTPAWRRFSLITGTLTAVPWFFSIGADLRDASQAPIAAQTIYAWGAQVEQGAFVTSLISTTAAAVNRAQDQCGILAANVSPWFATTGSWAAEFIIINPTPTGERILGAAVSASNGVAPLTAGNAPYHLGQWDGASYFETLNNITPNAVQKGAHASAGAASPAKLCLDGGTVQSLGSVTNGFASLATSGIRFLNTVAGANADNGSGYIRRVVFWPRVLSDAEMRQVTT